MTVRHLLEQKGRNLWTINPDATVLDAVAKMAEKDIGSLVVMDGEELIGIITERHYSRNVILKGKTSPTTLVRDIMERNVIYVRPEQSVELCMALMTEKRVRHLPVLEGKKVMGIARTTFIIGPDGKIKHVFNKVKPEGHAEQVLEYLKEAA